jgi:hypothetical protein
MEIKVNLYQFMALAPWIVRCKAYSCMYSLQALVSIAGLNY